MNPAFLFGGKKSYFFLLFAVFFLAGFFFAAHDFFFAVLDFFAAFFVAIAFPFLVVAGFVVGCYPFCIQGNLNFVFSIGQANKKLYKKIKKILFLIKADYFRTKKYFCL